MSNLSMPSWYNSGTIQFMIFQNKDGRSPDTYFIACEDLSEDCKSWNIHEHPKLKPFLKDKKIAILSSVLNDTENSFKFFCAYAADCYDPPLYLVACDQESDVEDVMIEETDLFKLSDIDLKDYDEDADYLRHTSDGTHDVESLNYFELKLTHIIMH